MGKHVLYISGKLFPVNSGDAIYSLGILERIASPDSSIDVLSFQYEETDANTEEYRYFSTLFRQMRLVPYRPKKWENYKKILLYGDSTQKYLPRMIEEADALLAETHYDVIILDHLRMFFLYDTIQKHIDRKRTKLVLIQHNIEHLNAREEIKYQSRSKDKWKLRLLNRGIKRLEYHAIHTVDEIWVISEEDKRIIAQMGKAADRIHVIPPYYNYPAIKEREQVEHPSYNLLLLGSMEWYPNVVGAVWFIENVFQELVKEDDRYRLYVVGRDPSPRIQKYHSEQIVVTGAVPSVDEYIRSCDFLIVPNTLGGGAKIKILEGIMKGIPVLATKESTVGYSVDIFDEDFCVNHPLTFVQKIIQLNKDAAKKVSFVSKARNILADNQKLKGILSP
ncbi:glycosyltransferase family 4 protein [Brevibacillus choshinensis]|uniref:Glycosyltransferase family 4 protein n=1 Tax=Brevibacillus choshinensis TaxID=54911 RepID=A0ABX7FJC0_BRECH|nr:glycosyltransferase family 4 protein [Brevibacillus choshinensis]QRG66227.1 glycosyltransferase family 4 protein [Brevibacillus choshinensis]